MTNNTKQRHRCRRSPSFGCPVLVVAGLDWAGHLRARLSLPAVSALPLMPSGDWR